jgi:hypothetical protein
VFVAFGTQREMRMRHIVNCGFSGSTVCFQHYITKGTIFEKKIAETSLIVRRTAQDMIKNAILVFM